jgi:excinuclease ABC subunit C
MHFGDTDPGLSLAVAVRDEAHRRAQRHHHARRDVSAKKSALEDVPGLGEKRARALLAAFKSLKKCEKRPLRIWRQLKG